MNKTLEYIHNNPKETKRIIGITYLQLKQLMENAIKINTNKKNAISAGRKLLIKSGGGRKKHLNPEDEIILTVYYLHHIPTFQILGIHFGVSESTANNIFHYWIDILRELLPPSLTIKVTEKKPVAIALTSLVSPKTKKLELKQIGYVDKDGVFVSNQVYKQLRQKSARLPKLRVLGTPQIYLPYWQDLYNLISQSSVTISEVDWQNPTNLILTTELGKVHIGGYNSKFPQQLMVLEKLKVITTKIPRDRIMALRYIVC